MVVVKEEDCQPRSSSSSSSSTRRRESVCRRDSEDSSRRSNADDTPSEKKLKLDDEAAPRLRLNASLATDPALRPAAVAALTVKPENTSPPNPVPPLPAGLQNGNYEYSNYIDSKNCKLTEWKPLGSSRIKISSIKKKKKKY